MHALFKDKDEIELSDFLKMRFELKKALMHFDFYQYDVKDEKISAEDFARSFISCLSFGKAHQYSKRINTIELKGDVSFNEFVAFSIFLEQSDIIKMKISTYRVLNMSMVR